MTGSEAWSIVAPIMAAHMHHYEDNLNALEEAYVLVFGALQLWDKKKKQKTNADRVRFMTDEELATWLGDMLGVYPFGTDQWDRQAWLDWLKKEVEE